MAFEKPPVHTEVAGDHGPVFVFPFGQYDDEDDSKWVRSPATDEQLDTFEFGIGAKLSVQLREWYKRYHPFEFFPRGFKYHYTAQDLAVLRLAIDPQDSFITDPVGLVRYSLLLDENHDSMTVLGTRARLTEYIPHGFLPFAAVSPGGNYLVMDLNPGEGHGSVWFMLIHGAASIAERGLELPLGYVAANFEEFLKSLFDEDAEIERQLEALG